jgi:hypothetical protein
LAEPMTRSIIFCFFVLIGCSNTKSRKDSRLATEMNAFLTSGNYEVQVKELGERNKSAKPVETQVTVTNNLGLIEFKGADSFRDLDSIRISLNDSTLVRQFSVNAFIDTISVAADKSGINQEVFGYAFGEDYSGGIADIPEFREFFSKEDISGRQALFIVGKTKDDKVVIKRIERIVSSGKILMDVNKVFILSRKSLY